MAEVPFIAIEGPIGIGKTSLAKKIASHFEFHLLKEIVSENPFLDKFYEDINEWSFQTEMFFLCNRYKQLEDIENDFLKNARPVVADYHIVKNMIFARRTLNESQLDKYGQIYEILTKDMPLPNLMIYITGSLDTIMERISKRGRGIEKNIEATYLQQLTEDYKQFMDAFEKGHPDIPLIRIDGDKTDFMQNQEHLETILEMIHEQLRLKGVNK
ncbi:deoxynucleoside kinase [Oceanobacillus alkalisoli]|uniref:deoxynucleoside kinase n=1 Tax=Oceanobacillus alkalisoli TaxID=2925113 RepID=UPI001F11F530|nr:deoxynucleoside kinase [Oceanobacillus alkalisoli]MCF3942125.1 deoxynucleoside kinase [Oceanobacillus alkalisoli]